MSAPLVPGQTFGPYALEAVVGIGGMGVVFRARETSRGQLVALKVLRSRDGAPPSDEERARFVREARLASGLVHPNVVAIAASGAIGTVPYIAMEWIEGASLAVRMEDRAVGLEARLDVLAGIADALAYAHRSGVVHRDLKPSNVMIDTRGTPKLVDFGIAKQSRDASQPFALAHTEAGIPLATRTGVLLGTPSYMAPEQMLSPEVDARVDQFAWGVLAYELLAGVHPRDTVAPGDAAFPVGRARPLGWQAPGVPEPVAAVVHRAMAYERDARFPSMGDVAAALRAARGAVSGPLGFVPETSGTGPAHGAPPAARSVPTTMEGVASRIAPSGPVVVVAPTSSRGPAPWIALGGVALVLLGVSAFYALRVASGEAPPPVVPGVRTVELVKGLEDIPFQGGAAGLDKAKAEVHRRIRPCIDARMEAEDDIDVDVVIGVDGHVTSVDTLNYCRRERGDRYLCTELGDPVKKGHPTPPSGMLECIREASSKLVFPPLVPRRREKYERPEMPEPTTAHLDLEAR